MLILFQFVESRFWAKTMKLALNRSRGTKKKSKFHHNDSPLLNQLIALLRFFHFSLDFVMTNTKTKPSQTTQLSWAINYSSTDVLNFSTFLWGWPTYWFMSKFCLFSWGWNFLCSSTGNKQFFLLSPRLCTPPNLKELRNDENFHSIFSDFSTDTILPGGTAMIP